jgi:hypothetical protein
MCHRVLVGWAVSDLCSCAMHTICSRFKHVCICHLGDHFGECKQPGTSQATLYYTAMQVQFSQEIASISKMCSMEGEAIRLSNPVQVTDAIEIWLASLAEEMKATLAAELMAATKDPSNSEASQVICLLDAIKFTKGYVKQTQLLLTAGAQ